MFPCTAAFQVDAFWHKKWVRMKTDLRSMAFVLICTVKCAKLLSGKYFQVQVWFTSNGDGLATGMKDAGTRQ